MPIFDQNDREVVRILDSQGREIETVYDQNGVIVYTKIREMTGTSPLTFTSRTAGTLTDYRIYGETLQDGTPSPDMPVDVVGCGVRTENLFDGYLESGGINMTNGTDYPNNNRFRSTYIPVKPNTTYTVCTEYDIKPYFNYLMYYNKNKTFLPPYVNTSQPYGRTFTFKTPSSGYYVRLAFSEDAYSSVEVSNPTNYSSDICLVESSIAPSEYIPYGYKIPVTYGGVTQNIYLDEPLRKIGDYADEVDFKAGTVTRRIVESVIEKQNVTQWGGYGVRATISNFTPSSYRSYQNNAGQRIFNVASGSVFFSMSGDSFNFVAEFKAIIDRVEQNGAKLYVYYVADTPTTESITLPTITTLNGTNTMSIDTTVKPSQMYIKGKIKPDGYGKLVDKNGVYILDKDGVQLTVHGQGQ